MLTSVCDLSETAAIVFNGSLGEERGEGLTVKLVKQWQFRQAKTAFDVPLL